MSALITSVPTLRDTLTEHPIKLWGNFYFAPVGPTFYKKAERIGKKISQISRGRKTRILSENSEIVGKVGEFLVRDFCEYYLHCPWESLVEVVNPCGGDDYDLKVGPSGKQVDVKTRQLHTDITIAPNFDLRVPEPELEKYQDFYVLAGYCPTSAYGYVLGWCTWEEMQSHPLKRDIKFPAKCVPLLDLHPMQTFAAYVSGL